MTNKSEFSDRLMQIIDNEEEKITVFASKMGFQRRTALYDILNKKCLPSFEFFYLFETSEYSKKYNLNWILTGKGEMIQNSSKKGHINSEKCFEKMTNYIEMLENEVKKLKEEIKNLKMESTDEKCKGNLDVAKGADDLSFKKEVC